MDATVTVTTSCGGLGQSSAQAPQQLYLQLTNHAVELLRLLFLKKPTISAAICWRN